MLSKSPSAIIFMTVFSVALLNRGEVRADFGSGTITFEESSYQLYTLTNTGGVATNVADGSTLTIADDTVVPITEYFKVGTDVYVRFGFDLDGDGDIDSSDTPAVIEATYAAGSGLNKKPDGSLGATILGGPFSDASANNDVFAYTSGSNPSEKTDFVASGYEDQAGNYFVRARKNANGGQESNVSGDQEIWDSFIIEYATTNGATVDSATGEIWDIDGTSTKREKFRVTATTTQTTAQSDSPTGDSGDSTSLDAKPWQWSFSGLSGSITQIKFTRFGDAYDGTNGGAVVDDNYKAYFPLAFNNFNPISAVGYVTPEPSSLLAFGGIFSLAVLRRRRRSASA